MGTITGPLLADQDPKQGPVYNFLQTEVIQRVIYIREDNTGS